MMALKAMGKRASGKLPDAETLWRFGINGAAFAAGVGAGLLVSAIAGQ